jgi:hypothetical protein
MTTLEVCLTMYTVVPLMALVCATVTLPSRFRDRRDYQRRTDAEHEIVAAAAVIAFLLFVWVLLFIEWTKQ